MQNSANSGGFWTFGIFLSRELQGVTTVKVNGVARYPHLWNPYREVTVSNDIDSVDVELDVLVGKTTRLTITKNTINGLKERGHYEGVGDIPMLHVWGASCTYDVDAGVREEELSRHHGVDVDHSVIYYIGSYTPFEHVISRGLKHARLKRSVTLNLGTHRLYEYDMNLIFQSRFIMGSYDKRIPNTNVWANAHAALTSTGPTLEYAVTAASTQKISTITIFPVIWVQREAGDLPVSTGHLLGR